MPTLGEVDKMQADWNDAGCLQSQLLEQLAHWRGTSRCFNEWCRGLRRLAQLTGESEEALITMLHEELERFED